MNAIFRRRTSRVAGRDAGWVFCTSTRENLSVRCAATLERTALSDVRDVKPDIRFGRPEVTADIRGVYRRRLAHRRDDRVRCKNGRFVRTSLPVVRQLRRVASRGDLSVSRIERHNGCPLNQAT